MPTVEFERVFQAAHRLSEYDGKCARIHGHNFHLRVRITAEDLDDQGFVIEFDRVKEVVDRFDHRLILSEVDTLHITTAEGWDLSDWIVRVPEDPTTENMAQHFADAIAALFNGGVGVRVETELRETDSIMATGRYPETFEALS